MLARFSGAVGKSTPRYPSGSHHPDLESCTIAKLRERIREADVPYHKKRLRVILLTALGNVATDIATDTGYTVRTIYNIRKDWWEGGWAAIYTVKGAPLVVDPNAIKDLIREYLWGTPPENYRVPRDHPDRFKWTGPQVRTFIKKRTGIEVGPKRRDAILKGLEQLRQNFTEEQLRIYYGDQTISLDE